MATVWDMEDTITERQQDGGRSGEYELHKHQQW